MHSFSTILVALSLSLSVLAAYHGNDARRHAELAVRARGDVLEKRQYSGVRMTWYDITVGPYVLHSLYAFCAPLPLTEWLVLVHITQRAIM
jgi:hypothetical protein